MTGATTAVLGYLTSINVLLLAFNLIPAFPLDGGRIARAIAWKVTGDRNRATRFAATLGRLGGYGMIGARRATCCSRGGSAVTGLWLGFIGFFLAQRGTIAPRRRRRSPGRIEHMRVADVMDAEPVAIPEDAAAGRRRGEYFLRYGWPWFPVVDATGRLVGVVSREAVESVPGEERDVPAGRLGDGPRRRRRAACASGSRSRSRRCWRHEGLARLGAIMAVDGEGVLRGIVTVDAVRRALQAPA